MIITITTSTGRSFQVEHASLDRLGKQDVLTFLCRRESHRAIRDAGFEPAEEEILFQVNRLRLAEQFTRFGDTGYRDMVMRVFGGHRLSPGMERRLREIEMIDVSDIDFRPAAIQHLREMWQFQCRLSDITLEQFYRSDERMVQ